MSLALFLLSPLLATVSGITLWPNNVVPFYCSKDFTSQECQLIQIATKEIQAHTCLKFVENSRGLDYVHIIKENGCYTNGLGKNPYGVTFMSLGADCLDKVTIIHEFFHALGIHHMHQRLDRDLHVTVNWLNPTVWSHLSQFLLSPRFYDLSMPYDYSSTMHYQTLRGALAPRDPEYNQLLGNARGASFYDYHTLNRLYGCYDKCPSQLGCRNGGVPNPRDCSKCNCPSGYVGDFCDKKPTTVTATRNWQKVQLKSPFLAETSFTRKENILWIEAPAYTLVEIRISDMEMSFSQEYQGDCLEYGLEIKANRDQRLGGPVVCNPSKTDVSHVYRSLSNIVPLIAYSGLKGQQHYEVEYRYL